MTAKHDRWLTDALIAFALLLCIYLLLLTLSTARLL
jgi:hypothetical protein